MDSNRLLKTIDEYQILYYELIKVVQYIFVRQIFDHLLMMMNIILIYHQDDHKQRYLNNNESFYQFK